jgi:hypothetical protein
MTGPGKPTAPGLAWRAPAQLTLGSLGTLELRQDNPALPAPPRPGEDHLGPLALRGVEALADGRGWRLTVEPLAPGVAVVPPLDLGGGQIAPELRLPVPRTTAYGAAWMGVGGGDQDRLPPVPFPWPWALTLALPLAVCAWFGTWRWRRGMAGRRRRAARRQFIHHWPPAELDRAALDQAHAAGRALLAAHFGPEALAWGEPELRHHGLGPWAAWAGSLDAARFGQPDPQTKDFPTLAVLLAPLERR